MMSSNNIAISAVSEVVLESPVVKIGSALIDGKVSGGNFNAGEPLVKGQTLVDRISALIDAVGLVGAIPTPMGPSGTLNSSPNWTAVTTALDQVQQCLSSKHLIDS